MATINAIKSGLWSDSTVWSSGTLPADGDDVNITNFAITYDLNNSATAYNIITLSGTSASLAHTNSTPTAIKAHRLYIYNGSKYEMVPNSTHIIQAKTNDSNGGRIYMNADSASKFICNGSIANPSSTISFFGQTSVTVADTTGFGVGEYVAIYNATSKAKTECSDEGFIVNSINGNIVSLRKRVGPCAVITGGGSGSAYFIVDDARKFQTGMHIVLDGNGADDLVIQDIDLSTNKLILNRTVSSSYNNYKIYESGFDRTHAVGHTLYKLCTQTTADAIVGATTITVINKGNISVGDRISIEGTASSWVSDDCKAEDKVVTAINGNTLTLDSALTIKHDAGAIVIKLSRDCTIKSDGNIGAFILIESTGNNNRTVDLNYLGMEGLCNGYTNTYRGLCIRGYFDNGICSVNGVSFYGCYDVDWCGILLYNSYNHTAVRNSVTYKCHSGIFQYYPSNNGGVFNCMGMYNYYSAFRNNGITDRTSLCYNISSNSDEYGAYYETFRGRVITSYPTSYYDQMNFFHNIFRFDRDSIYFFKPNTFGENGNIRRLSIQNSYYEPYWSECTDDMYIFESEIVGPFKYTGYDRGSSYADQIWANPAGNFMVFPNCNFIPDNHIMYTWRGKAQTDFTNTFNGKPTLKFNNGSGGYSNGVAERLYVNKGDKISILVYMMVDSSYNHSTYPRIRVQGHIYQPLVTTEMLHIPNRWIPVKYNFTAQYSEFIFIQYHCTNNAGSVWFANSSISIEKENVHDNWFMGNSHNKLTNNIKKQPLFKKG